MVSTHSRAEAAASFYRSWRLSINVSTHSRAEAAAQKMERLENQIFVSTHSRAEAAAFYGEFGTRYVASFNTQPRGGGCVNLYQFTRGDGEFQHTAARRRLQNLFLDLSCGLVVSTHSRAEAAAPANVDLAPDGEVSTHSRAEAAALNYINHLMV